MAKKEDFLNENCPLWNLFHILLVFFMCVTRTLMLVQVFRVLQ